MIDLYCSYSRGQDRRLSPVTADPRSSHVCCGIWYESSLVRAKAIIKQGLCPRIVPRIVYHGHFCSPPCASVRASTVVLSRLTARDRAGNYCLQNHPTAPSPREHCEPIPDLRVLPQEHVDGQDSATEVDIVSEFTCNLLKMRSITVSLGLWMRELTNIAVHPSKTRAQEHASTQGLVHLKQPSAGTSQVDSSATSAVTPRREGQIGQRRSHLFTGKAQFIYQPDEYVSVSAPAPFLMT
nr:hypothetical protein CFP56_07423 [Quercus suber]